MVYCDNCAKEIGADIESRLKSVEDDYDLYYDLKNEIKNIIKKSRASKIKSKFKRFLYKFNVISIDMPIRGPSVYEGLDFCDSHCQDEWKNKIKKYVLSEQGDGGPK